jgi:hypothetical protein
MQQRRSAHGSAQQPDWTNCGLSNHAVAAGGYLHTDAPAAWDLTNGVLLTLGK